MDRLQGLARAEGRMSFQQKECLMIYLLRVRQVFQEAFRPFPGRDHSMMPEDWNLPTELGYGIMWRCAVEHYKQYGQMVSATALQAQVEHRFSTHAGEIPQPLVDDTLKGIDWFFQVDDAALTNNAKYGVDLLKSFLTERTVTDPLKSVWRTVGDANPADLPDILRNYQSRADYLQNLTTKRTVGLFEAVRNAKPLILFPTGIPFWDKTMNGGMARKEVIGLSGATGSGKTRRASMVAGEVAMRESLEAVEQARQAEGVVMFSYENPLEDVSCRILSYLARVNQNRLAKFMPDWDLHLSSTRLGRPLEAYELLPSVQSVGPAHAVGTDVPMLGELERLALIEPLTRNIRAHDMRRQAGGVPELEALLQRSIDNGEFPKPKLVIVDFVDEMVRLSVGSVKGNDITKNTHYLLDNAIPQLHDLADKFDCTVIALMQLSGDALTQSPTARVSLADTKGCRTTAIKADFTFQFGVKDNKNNAVLEWAGKTRRAESVRQEYQILHYRSEYADLFVSDRLVVHNNSLTEKEMADQFGGSASRSATPPSRQTRVDDLGEGYS